MAARPGALRLLLLAELALVGWVLAAQLPHWWEQRWVQDDAYVSFRYARNLVRGEGLVYNVGDRVEGYTNFLWTALAALPLARGADDPLPFMYLVSAGLWVASYGLLLGLGIGLWARGVWAAPLALIPLAYQWSFNLWFFSAMETPLVTCLIIAAVCCVALDPRRHAWGLAAASACATALMLTRPDGVVVFAALGLAVLWQDGGWIVRRRRWWRGFVAPAVPLLLVLAPFEAWRLWYYGSLFPNTYYAKAAYAAEYGRGLEYLWHYLSIYRLWLFLPLWLGAAALPMPQLARRFLVAAGLAGVAVALYVVRLGGDFMEWRFLTPVSGVVYPSLVVAACVVGQWAGRRWHQPTSMRSARGSDASAGRGDRRSSRVAGGVGSWLAGVMATALLTWATIAATPAARTSTIGEQETIALLRRYVDPGRFDWRQAAALFDAVLPREAHIATTSAGIIPFVCDRPTLDLHGLTDAVIAHTPINPQERGRMGHEHWLQDFGLIRARGVDVILDWADPNLYPRSAATPPHDGGEMVSVRLDDGRYIDFTLLNPALKPRLTDPRLVFYDATRIADRALPHAVDVSGWTMVDRLDWGEQADEARHAFAERQPAAAPYEHSWHTKMLTYLPPLDGVQLEDNGRRIFGSAEWDVSGVTADRDLRLVARVDYTGGAVYDLEVNGQPVVDPLVTPWRPSEVWGDIELRIPRQLLVAGTNHLRLVRRGEPGRDAEFFYMWFLQPAS
ncbi:MAG: hypothetical protein ABI629_00985 [bacterium]